MIITTIRFYFFSSTESISTSTSWGSLIVNIKLKNKYYGNKKELNRVMLYLQTFSIIFLNFSTELPKTSAVNIAPPAPAPSLTNPFK